MIACMGGFCLKREQCAAYVIPPRNVTPAERFCERGQERPVPFSSEKFAAWLAGQPMEVDHDGR